MQITLGTYAIAFFSANDSFQLVYNQIYNNYNDVSNCWNGRNKGLECVAGLDWINW